MPSLWFVVPAHGRAQLARICLRQLRRTCDQLNANGIAATAVVIADDENLRTARELGFETVRDPTGSSAASSTTASKPPATNATTRYPADYVVPCGSDDWIDWRILLKLPGRHSIMVSSGCRSSVRTAAR
jgi:hypothetical protein